MNVSRQREADCASVAVRGPRPPAARCQVDQMVRYSRAGVTPALALLLGHVLGLKRSPWKSQGEMFTLPQHATRSGFKKRERYQGCRVPVPAAHVGRDSVCTQLINDTSEPSLAQSARFCSRVGCLIRSYLMCKISQRFHICGNPGNSCSTG